MSRGKPTLSAMTQSGPMNHKEMEINIPGCDLITSSQYLGYSTGVSRVRSA